jgi:hypothetical protein
MPNKPFFDSKFQIKKVKDKKLKGSEIFYGGSLLLKGKKSVKL